MVKICLSVALVHIKTSNFSEFSSIKTLIGFSIIFITFCSSLILKIPFSVCRGSAAIYILVLFILSLVSITLCVNKFALINALPLYLGFFSFFLVLQIKRDSIEGFLKSIFLISFAVSVVGLLQHFRVLPLPLNVYWGENPHATMGITNITAGYIVTVLPLGLLVFKERGLRQVLFLTAFLIVFFYFLVLKGRGAYMGFLLSSFTFILILILRKFSIVFKLRYIFILLPVFLLLLTKEGTKAIRRLASSFDFHDKAIELRFEMWKSAIMMFRDNPFGVGIGNFSVNTYKYQSKNLWDLEFVSPHKYIFFDFVHNDYLQILSEIGFLGGLILFLFIFRMLKFFFVVDDLASHLIIFGILSSVVNSIFNFPLFSPASSVHFFVLCGILEVRYSKERIKLPNFLIIPALPVLLVFIWLSADSLFANYRLSKGFFHLRQGDIRAREWYERSTGSVFWSAKGCLISTKLDLLKVFEKQEILSFLKNCLNLYPFFAPGWERIGSIMAEIGKFEEAKRAFAYASSFPYPGRSISLIFLAKIYLFEGNCKQATLLSKESLRDLESHSENVKRILKDELNFYVSEIISTCRPLN